MNRRTQGGCGLYGKLIQRGDFEQSGLPVDFVQPWDQWLQNSLSESQRQLGKAWLDGYLRAPLWRFVLGADTCAAAPFAGVWMASVDRVGRYFPLTLAGPVAETASLEQLLRADDWFVRVEQLALTALDDHLEVSRFHQAVQCLPLPGAPSSPPTPGAVGRLTGSPVARRGDPTGHYWLLSALDSHQQLHDAIAATFARPAWRCGTLWWTTGSPTVRPVLVASPTMPTPKQFCGFLDGRWRHWGWSAP